MNKKIKNAIGLAYLASLVFSMGCIFAPEKYGNWLNKFFRGLTGKEFNDWLKNLT